MIIYAQTSFEKAEQLYRENKFQESIELLEPLKNRSGKWDYLLSVCYYNLNNEHKGALYMEAAADKGYTHAVYLSGGSHLYGYNGHVKNVKKAEERFRTLVIKGEEYAEESLEELFYILDDDEEANKLLEFGINKKYSIAFYLVATAYYHGKWGYNRDVNKAEIYYKQAIDANGVGTNLAMAEYGLLLSGKDNRFITASLNENGSLEFVKDNRIEEALKLWEQAMERGEELYSPYYLALYKYEPLDNYDRALSLYKMSANKGNIDAQCKIGDYFREGKFVSQDFNEAIKWYMLAADKNHGHGELMLGLCYEQLYRKTDDDRYLKNALKYFYRANLNGQARAIKTKKDNDGYNTFELVNPSLPLYEEGVLKAKSYSTFEEWEKQVVAKLAIDSDVDVNIPQLTADNINTYVLVIANENYEYEQYVPYAENDGTIFAKYCKYVLGIPEENIHLIVDARLNKIKWELDWLSTMGMTRVSPQLIIYYSGHGLPAEDLSTSYLLPVDGFSKDTSTGINLTYIYDLLSRSKDAKSFVFLDACFSGAKRNGEMLTSSRGVAIKAKRVVPKGQVVTITACQGTETAYPYEEQKHGMFTYYLLKKLNETKGNVTLGELGDYITTQVKQQSVVVNRKSQTPTVVPSSAMNADWRNWKLK